jgi:Flp pilus assembly protein protease CpaA
MAAETDAAAGPSAEDRAHSQSLYEIDQKYRTVRTLIRTGGVVLVAYFGFRALQVLGGKDTSLSVVLTVVLNAFVELKFILAITLAGICAAWAALERALRPNFSLGGRITA